jgi:hypothetical protein
MNLYDDDSHRQSINDLPLLPSPNPFQRVLSQAQSQSRNISVESRPECSQNLNGQTDRSFALLRQNYMLIFPKLDGHLLFFFNIEMWKFRLFEIARPFEGC